MQQVQHIPRPPQVLQHPPHCCKPLFAVIYGHYKVALLLNRLLLALEDMHKQITHQLQGTFKQLDDIYIYIYII
jgi:hypothetical protein